jgi:hypothetical protein
MRAKRFRTNDGGTYAIRPPAVIMNEDHYEHPVRWITEFIRENQPLRGGTGSTYGQPGRGNAFSEWIGPGRYTSLRFFRIGETLTKAALTNELNREFAAHTHNDPVSGVTGAPNSPNQGRVTSGDFVIYGGVLALWEVPLRSCVNLQNISIGHTSFVQAEAGGSAGDRVGGRGTIQPGLARVEPGTARQEVIAIRSVFPGGGSGLFAGTAFQIPHHWGARIEEYADSPRYSITEAFVIPFYGKGHVPDVTVEES